MEMEKQQTAEPWGPQETIHLVVDKKQRKGIHGRARMSSAQGYSFGDLLPLRRHQFLFLPPPNTIIIL